MNRLGSAKSPFFFAVSYDGQEACIVPEGKNSDPPPFLISMGKPITHHYAGKRPGKFRFEKFPENEVSYTAKFNRVMEHIHAGDTYLLNLTCCTPIRTTITPEDIFHYSEARYKVLVPGHFVVFSPEIFITIKNNIISGFPMKGTIDADIPGAEEIILGDTKETAEHNTIVDLIRNDLGMAADQISVRRFRYIDKITTNSKTLLQVSSEISGQLPEGWQASLGTILYKMLPAGSVTGAPKMRTTAIIRDIEGYERGFYTGVTGYFDGESLDSGVMIRFIEQTVDGLVFKSGGGITFLSNVHDEYHEMIDKVYVPVF